MKINLKYISAFFILFSIEVFIALFVKDTIIRPYVGDILVVILMYVFIRGFIDKSIKYLPMFLFLFALTIEISQYFKLVEILNFQDNRVISIVLGTSFSWIDIICYLIGTLLLVIWEKLKA